jgi:hypothetical protein
MKWQWWHPLSTRSFQTCGRESCAVDGWRWSPLRGTQKELEKRKLQTSGLGMLFHLRDLFGSRKLMRVETTCGTMLRLRKE